MFLSYSRRIVHRCHRGHAFEFKNENNKFNIEQTKDPLSAAESKCVCECQTPTVVIVHISMLYTRHLIAD